MPFIEPLNRTELSNIEDALQGCESFLGFLPNDVLTMGHMPEATAAFMDFCLTLYSSATLPQPLLHLVGMVASAASGCRYCTAHTANKAFEEGVDAEKVSRVWEYESSDLFGPHERAALRLAQKAGQSPSQTEESDFIELRKHFTEREIVELLFVICQFGFWNRWNDSVGTRLESTPKRFSEDTLPEQHWSLSKHA